MTRKKPTKTGPFRPPIKSRKPQPPTSTGLKCIRRPGPLWSNQVMPLCGGKAMKAPCWGPDETPTKDKSCPRCWGLWVAWKAANPGKTSSG